MWEGLGGLRSSASDLGIQIARLKKSEHEEMLTRMRKEAPQIRKSLVSDAQVVATTLAMLRMRPELRDRAYDHVMVDEVSFAPSPDVIYAASRATTGVTLLGDFLQNGPIMPDKVKSLRNLRDRTQGDHWYGQDLFAFFKITSPRSASATPAAPSSPSSTASAPPSPSWPTMRPTAAC